MWNDSIALTKEGEWGQTNPVISKENGSQNGKNISIVVSLRISLIQKVTTWLSYLLAQASAITLIYLIESKLSVLPTKFFYFHIII